MVPEIRQQIQLRWSQHIEHAVDRFLDSQLGNIIAFTRLHLGSPRATGGDGARNTVPPPYFNSFDGFGASRARPGNDAMPGLPCSSIERALHQSHYRDVEYRARATVAAGARQHQATT
jgi:hypothetical protein